MMTRILLTAALVAPVTAAAQALPAAQTQPAPAAPVATSPARLTGCVANSPGATGGYTFTNGVDGNRFNLTGKDVRKYAGQMVEVTQEAPKKFRVGFGLYPSPNVAAQAGAQDSVQAAIATQPGGGARGTGELPELRASRIRAVSGACE